MVEPTTPEEAARLGKRAREIADQFNATFYPQEQEDDDEENP